MDYQKVIHMITRLAAGIDRMFSSGVPLLGEINDENE
jgi:hypothetical protein